MKTTPRIITALAIAGAFVTTAVQAAESGPYIRLENGVNSISGAKTKIALRALPAGVEGKAKFDSSYVYGGAVGYSFGSFATEVELDHSDSKLKSVGGVDVTSPTTFNGGITFRQTTLLANAIYKLPLAESVSLNLSGGLGAQFQSTKLHESPVLKQKSDTAFVGQLSPSVSFNLSKNLSLSAGYKLRFVDETRVAHYDDGDYKADAKLSSHWDHVFTVGVGFSF
jgi:hypothetical protein